MNTKQMLNNLPRPTFRWTKVNYLEDNIEKIESFNEAITMLSDRKVPTITDTNLIDETYEGINDKSLQMLLEDDVKTYEIKVPKNQAEEFKINILLNKAMPNAKLRVRVIAEDNSSVNLKIACESNIPAKVHLFTEIVAKENAKVKIAKAQILSDSSEQYEHRITKIADSAKVEYVNIEVGSKKNIYNFVTKLDGKESDLRHDFAYLGINQQHFDVSMVMTHQGVKSNSDIQHVGALNDSAKKSFRGTIDFLRGCIGSTGNEEDTCLLLNDTVKSISLPLLLCREDNVTGNHAASAGQIEPDKLYYLMSRGFSETEAKHILVESILRPVIAKINDEEIEIKVFEFLNGRV